MSYDIEGWDQLRNEIGDDADRWLDVIEDLIVESNDYDAEFTQVGVLQLPPTGRPAPPAVEALARHLEQAKHPIHFMIGLLSLDEPEDRYRVERFSLAKKAAAEV